MEKLIKKGLANYIIKEKTKYFNASSPNRILDFLHEKEKQIKEKEKELEKEIPFLLKLQESNKKKHETYLYKGFKGIQTAIFGALENLNQNHEVLAMGVISSKNEKYNLLWQNWHNQRIKKNSSEPIDDPIKTNNANILGTLNMLVASRDANVKRFIYAASSSAYGDSKVMPKEEAITQCN